MRDRTVAASRHALLLAIGMSSREPCTRLDLTCCFCVFCPLACLHAYLHNMQLRLRIESVSTADDIDVLLNGRLLPSAGAANAFSWKPFPTKNEDLPRQARDKLQKQRGVFFQCREDVRSSLLQLRVDILPDARGVGGDLSVARREPDRGGVARAPTAPRSGGGPCGV